MTAVTWAPAQRRRGSTAWFGVGALALSAAALYYQLDIRRFEVWFGARALGLFGTTGTDGTVVYAWLDTRSAIGLNITPECTVALLGLPVLITVVVLAWRRKINRTRLAVAGIAGLAVVFLGNQLRLAAIAFATRWWGLGFGFDFSHQVVGSVISLVTACLGVLVVMWLATMGKSTRAARSY